MLIAELIYMRCHSYQITSYCEIQTQKTNSIVLLDFISKISFTYLLLLKYCV